MLLTQLNKQKGLSLLELIVSLALGVIILLGLMQVYQTGSQSSSQAKVIVEMNEKANRVMQQFKREFNRAGYIDSLDHNPDPALSTQLVAETLANLNDPDIMNLYERAGGRTTQTPFEKITGIKPVLACNGRFKDKTAACEGNSTGKSPEKAQSIQLAYQVVSNTNQSDRKSLRSRDGADAEFSGIKYDCTGQSIGSGNGIVMNRYFLDGEELKCQSLGAGVADSDKQQLIVDDVVEFVPRYRVTEPTNATTKVLSGLQTRHLLYAKDLGDTAKNPLGNAGITGVEICMIVKSENIGSAAKKLAEVQNTIPSCLGGSAERKEGDNSYYKRYVSSFSLPNMIYFNPRDAKSYFGP